VGREVRSLAVVSDRRDQQAVEELLSMELTAERPSHKSANLSEGGVPLFVVVPMSPLPRATYKGTKVVSTRKDVEAFLRNKNGQGKYLEINDLEVMELPDGTSALRVSVEWGYISIEGAEADTTRTSVETYVLDVSKRPALFCHRFIMAS
jgi:hypothetical protein